MKKNKIIQNKFVISFYKNFDGRRPETSEPENVDANGAYHIALQGLRIIQKRIKDGKIIPDGTGRQIYNWLEFVQKKEYMG